MIWTYCKKNKPNKPNKEQCKFTDIGAMVVMTVLLDMVSGLTMKAGEVGITDWPWSWGSGHWVVVSQDIYVYWVFFGFCCICCCSHCFYIRNDDSDQSSSLGIEAPSILENESFLENDLPRAAEAAWIGRDGDLWCGKLSWNRLIG